MKTKRNNRRNKNKTRRRGGAVKTPSTPAVKMPKRAVDMLEIYIEPYVKELNTSGSDKYKCLEGTTMGNMAGAAGFEAPENCVSNTDYSTFKQILIKDYISNYDSNLIDRYIKDKSHVNFVSGIIETRLNTKNKASNIKSLWNPYLVDGDFTTKNSYNVVVSSHQHLIDKLLKWKPPEQLLKLNIRNNNNTHANKAHHLKYMDKGLIYGEKEKDKKMGLRNGMVIMFEFDTGKMNSDSDVMKIKVFCETTELTSGKNKYLYPPIEEQSLVEYFDDDYIKDIKDWFQPKINNFNQGKSRFYRLYIIRHKYSIHNKNESQPEDDEEIKVLNSPLAYKSTVPTEEDILGEYKLKATDHNRFISSPLNRAIETLILFLNNNSNWEGENPYIGKLDDILGKFKEILVNRCNADIADKARGKLSKTELSKLGKCGELKPKRLSKYDSDMKRAQTLHFRAAAQKIKKAEEKLKFYTPKPKPTLAKVESSYGGDGSRHGRKTRKRKHKRKTRRKKNKKRQSRRRSIKRQ